MDTHEKLVFESDACVAVLGRGTSEFVLVDLDEPYDEAAAKELVKRGYGYCGCMAVRNGQAAARCQPDGESMQVMLLASFAFAQMVADRLKAAPKGDAAEWLQRLHDLPDTRGSRG
jgi:hypothetical protein